MPLGEPEGSPTDNSILPGGQDVNIQAVSPDSSVGAAPAGFDAYGRLIGKYGAIEPGENPAPHSYAVEVPRQTTENDRVSLSARTIMEAAVTPDAMIPDLAQMVVDGKFSRIPVSNKKSISNAETRIRQVEYQNALMSWIQDVKNGNVSEQTMAMGAVLYNNAATAGDGKTDLDIADVARHIKGWCRVFARFRAKTLRLRSVRIIIA